MKILKWKINEKIVAIIAVVCFVFICLMPLLLIAKYDHPCADDFSYGYYAHVTWKETHSIIETLKAAAYTTHENWYAWQGTFTSIFLMSLTPAVFGEQYYAAVPFMMLGMLTLSVFYLSKVLIHDILKSSISNSIILSVILLFMMIEGIYTPASAFFWYNAAVHYTFMQSVMFLMVAFALRSINSDKKIISIITSILSVFCAFVVSGGNYLNALIGLIILISLLGLFIGLFIWNKKNKAFGKFYLLFFPLIVYVIGFVINVIAPGNAVRGANFVDTPAFTAIVRSFGSGFQYCSQWVSLYTVILLILALPTIWIVVGKTKFLFRYPALVVIFSFCLFSATFTSSHYGMGGPGLPRTFNNCKMLYHMLLVINEVYLVGWIHTKLKAFSKDTVIKTLANHGVVFYTIVMIMLAVLFITCDNKEAHYPSYASAKYIHEGFALHYHVQFLERLSIINGPEKTIYVKEIEPKLHVLYVDDVTTDAGDWRNQQYARWYGKEAVILIPTPE